MENVFKDALLEGEELLWTGKSEDFVTLDKTHKSKFLIKAVISFLIFAGFSISLLSKDNNTLLVVILAAIEFWIVYSGFGDAKAIKKLIYGVTNKRILIYINQAVKETKYEYIDSVSTKIDADGHTSFLFGPEAQSLKDYQLRGIAALGIKAKSELSPCERFVMYAIEKPDELKDVLSKFLRF